MPSTPKRGVFIASHSHYSAGLVGRARIRPDRRHRADRALLSRRRSAGLDRAPQRRAAAGRSRGRKPALPHRLFARRTRRLNASPGIPTASAAGALAQPEQRSARKRRHARRFSPDIPAHGRSSTWMSNAIATVTMLESADLPTQRRAMKAGHRQAFFRCRQTGHAFPEARIARDARHPCAGSTDGHRLRLLFRPAERSLRSGRHDLFVHRPVQRRA